MEAGIGTHTEPGMLTQTKGNCSRDAHTSQRVEGIEPQSKVPQAREELFFHLPGGGIVHALQGEGSIRKRGCLKEGTTKLFLQSLSLDLGHRTVTIRVLLWLRCSCPPKAHAVIHEGFQSWLDLESVMLE